ncbi:hypothetical protein RvY_09245 [Ramazzottius varieornatus]|uniref:Uncharacterized protein n=1 Tax=Ramazzottius varieornatus TaxID=947166 RepID=A0A1D1VD91_RAMVA|nr:hypothetical protein RvY_09245 [Ramazzottius varieornatus]
MPGATSSSADRLSCWPEANDSVSGPMVSCASVAQLVRTFGLLQGVYFSDVTKKLSLKKALGPITAGISVYIDYFRAPSAPSGEVWLHGLLTP